MITKGKQINSSTGYRLKPLAALLPALILIGCGGGGSEGIDNTVSTLLSSDVSNPSSEVSVRVDLPQRVMNLGEDMVVEGTVSGLTGELTESSPGEYRGTFQLPFNVEHTIYLSVRRQSDNLLLGTAQQQQLVSNTALNVYVPEHQINMDIDSDGDGFSNIREVEDGADPFGRDGDYDGDGNPDAVDTDDDNDGVADVNDAFPYNANETVDTDSDAIGDNSDPDDDNDGIDDGLDQFPRDSSEWVDTDGDGIGNNADTETMMTMTELTTSMTDFHLMIPRASIPIMTASATTKIPMTTTTIRTILQTHSR